MENMKRAISAVLAFVLVLGMMPGVPMFAGAEEVETQPETVAVETTEAATVPEETEVAETTEATEETVPQQTTAPVVTEEEETVPQETETEETIPQETVSEETVPQETVTEETDLEIQEELEATEEAVDGVVLNAVNNIKVSASTLRTYVGAKVQLKAEVLPENAEMKDVVFYVVEEGSDTIAYDEELLTEKGILRTEEPGTLVIAARAVDQGEASHDSVTQEKDGTVKVTFVDYTMVINKEKDAIDRDNPDGDHWFGEDQLRLMTGEKLKLFAYYKVDGVASLPLEGLPSNIKWELAEGDEKYASISANGTEVTVTAGIVTASKVITLIAREETLGVVDSITMTVYPIPYKVGIYDADSEEVTNQKLTVPLTTAVLEENKDKGYVELELSAQVWPLEAEEPMVWEASDALVQVKHPELEAEEGQEPELDTTKATLRVYFQAGETTITITSKNYPDVTSKVTIVRKFCMGKEDIEFHQKTEDLSTKGVGLLSGKSFQLEVYDIRNPQAPELLTSKTVKWSLAEGDDAYASISAEGKLTAKKGLLTGAQVTVRCAILDNEEAYLELPVIIRPLATEVRILAGDLAEEPAEENSLSIAEDEILNGKTIAVDTSEGCDPFELAAVVLPNDEHGALQDVTWSSSKTAIAVVDPDTDEIVWKGKNGTTTITATAKDGSGKKASVNLKFGAQVKGIEIVQDESFFLRSGQSWTFSVNFTPANPTDKGLTWSLVNPEDSKYVTLSAGGKLSAKTVYEDHVVTIKATAKDGSGVSAQTEVLIKPKNDGILTLKGYGSYVSAYQDYVTKTTQTIPVGDTIDLEAYILGEDIPEDVKWKVSSKAKAELFTDFGGTTTVTMLNTGSVTVTATSLNDPKKSATVTLKGVRMTAYIDWTHTHEQTELACGKSLTLKAKAYDAEDKTPTISKLAWSIEGDGAKYAKVSNGKVTAIAGAVGPYDAPKEITVVVAATDGSGIKEYYDILIYPAVQSIVINRPEEVRTGTNIFVMENPGSDGFTMSAQVWPANALQSVTWKSSSKAIAEIDPETGDLICKKAGNVTITATANDGSGRKATYKLTILARPTHVDFDKLLYYVVAGGRTLKLKPILMDGNYDKISGKKLEWKVLPAEGMEDGTAYVTSISGGTLKTKKVTEPKCVKVVLRTVEKYDEWETEFERYVWIYPETKSVTITSLTGKPESAIKWCYLEDGGVSLSAVTEAKAGEVAYPDVAWSTSNKSIAEVDETGNVTFKKVGTVKITATAVDGSGVKDTIQITIRK